MELLGEDLSKYGGYFDLHKYYSNKDGFIKTIILNKHKNHMNSEIFDLMTEKDFVVPRSVVLSVSKTRLREYVKKVSSFFKIL